MFEPDRCCHVRRRSLPTVRSARLVKTLLYLQGSGFATAPELADELEVPTRTVTRLLEVRTSGPPDVASGGQLALMCSTS